LINEKTNTTKLVLNIIVFLYLSWTWISSGSSETIIQQIYYGVNICAAWLALIWIAVVYKER